MAFSPFLLPPPAILLPDFTTADSTDWLLEDSPGEEHEIQNMASATPDMSPSVYAMPPLVSSSPFSNYTMDTDQPIEINPPRPSQSLYTQTYHSCGHAATTVSSPYLGPIPDPTTLLTLTDTHSVSEERCPFHATAPASPTLDDLGAVDYYFNHAHYTISKHIEDTLTQYGEHSHNLRNKWAYLASEVQRPQLLHNVAVQDGNGEMHPYLTPLIDLETATGRVKETTGDWEGWVRSGDVMPGFVEALRARGVMEERKVWLEWLQECFEMDLALAYHRVKDRRDQEKPKVVEVRDVVGYSVFTDWGERRGGEIMDPVMHLLNRQGLMIEQVFTSQETDKKAQETGDAVEALEKLHLGERLIWLNEKSRADVRKENHEREDIAQKRHGLT